MPSFKLYVDSGLTTPFVGTWVAKHFPDQSQGDQEGVLYFGSVVASRIAQAASTPGVDTIDLTLFDNDVDPGNGPELTDYKLSLTQAGLDSAVAGAPLSIGTTISSGAGNAVPVWVRRAPVDNGGVLVNYVGQTGYATNLLDESAV